MTQLSKSARKRRRAEKLRAYTAALVVARMLGVEIPESLKDVQHLHQIRSLIENRGSGATSSGRATQTMRGSKDDVMDALSYGYQSWFKIKQSLPSSPYLNGQLGKPTSQLQPKSNALMRLTMQGNSTRPW